MVGLHQGLADLLSSLAVAQREGLRLVLIGLGGGQDLITGTGDLHALDPCRFSTRGDAQLGRHGCGHVTPDEYHPDEFATVGDQPLPGGVVHRPLNLYLSYLAAGRAQGGDVDRVVFTLGLGLRRTCTAEHARRYLLRKRHRRPGAGGPAQTV